MKELLKNFIKQNNATLKFLETTGRDFENADEIIEEFAEKVKASSYNPALGNDFANNLQLCGYSETIDQYELKDIRALYKSLLKLQEYNLENYTEAAHFEWAVMDNPTRAKKIVAEGFRRCEQKMDELHIIMKLIDDK